MVELWIPYVAIYQGHNTAARMGVPIRKMMFAQIGFFVDPDIGHSSGKLTTYGMRPVARDVKPEWERQ